MGEVMRPIPFERMLEWISGEYGKQRSIFGIPESCFFRKSSSSVLNLFGDSCDTPIGPAAGPHTQLAQNIVAAYLVGGRFIELKTVQKLDSLQIEKPCIDARDEGYNTEWSTELSLEEAYDEYVKAWLLLHFLERAFDMRKTEARSFLFNMSVGYDLEGIRTEKMQSFIDGLMDASRHVLYQRHLRELESFVAKEGNLAVCRGASASASLRRLPGEIPTRISNSVTLSTMHGCPPNEIEAICTYLLKEKGLHTFVKLNPTLLGYEKVKTLLEARGFDYVGINESTFAKDLQYEDATRMIQRLVETSSACGRKFGVKLSNTLGARNLAGLLPGEEMYMSGRALFPLTISLAAKLAREFQGALAISFSGGASQWNAPELFEAGIRPITVATDLLKPGGYLRMKEIADRLEPLLEKGGKTGSVDPAKLDRIVEDSATKINYQKAWRGEKKVQVEEKLPLLDCYVAPCVRACPIHQDVPEYIRLAQAGRFDEALEVIYRTNPLPNITGHICDHQCMHNCTRKDYEGPVLIREIKRIAAKHAGRAYRAQGRRQAGRPDIKVAVIGAGPAGLAASCFLARAGCKVTVFEKNRSAGGVVGSVLPRFRIPAAAIRRDIRTIESMGVDFRFGAAREFSIQALRTEGFKYLFIAIGAEVSRKLELGGDNPSVYDSLSFLRSLRRDGHFAGLGGRVAVIGGGNTAIDSARAAKRLKGVEEVTIVYRRTEKEMPADREELENAVHDGVAFEYLLSPEAFLETGVLKCRMMRLGSPDPSGRRRAEPTEEIRELPFDSVISAIGEQADSGLLEGAGLKPGPEGGLKADPETLETEFRSVYVGGDAFRGPATVVESIADARRAAAAILTKENLSLEDPEGSRYARDQERFLDIYGKKGKLRPAIPFRADRKVARNEHLRCLECDSVCNKCVDVCPNRANLYIAVDEEHGFRNAWQILHLAALCNECGNCGTFCPYDGLPYKDKLTLFSSKADFDRSGNDGFYVSNAAGWPAVHLRLHGVLREPSGEGPENREMEQVLAIANTVLKDYGYLLNTSS
jgi:putative selenate reductase